MGIDRGTAPVPGESPLGIIVVAVLTALMFVAMIGSIVAGFFAPGLGPTIAVCVVLFLLSLGALLGAWLVRRQYLRAVRNGTVIEREKWSGADLLPPG